MKNIRVFVSENFQFLEMKFSIYLNRRVLIMTPVRSGIVDHEIFSTAILILLLIQEGWLSASCERICTSTD